MSRFSLDVLFRDLTFIIENHAFTYDVYVLASSLDVLVDLLGYIFVTLISNISYSKCSREKWKEKTVKNRGARNCKFISND